MKKFTGNFLSGGYRSALHIFRSIALGLVALLSANSAVFAQRTCPPPPDSVYFYVDKVDDCYKATNLYKVNVSVMDFENVDSLNLFLDYNQVYWTFKSAKVLEPIFKSTAPGPPGSVFQNHPMTISDDGSVLNFKWTEWIYRGTIAASIGAKVPVVELTFELKNFPNNTLASYINTLGWTTNSKTYHCDGDLTFTEWKKNVWNNGYIKTAISYNAVVVDVVPDTLDCATDRAFVTVTSPTGVGYKYSFNGGLTWNTNNTAEAEAGDHVVQVQDASGCLSVKKYFTIESRGILDFFTGVVDESCANLGEITLNITDGGIAPIAYWCVPKAVYDLKPGGPFDATKYSSVTNQFLLPAGVYWSAVQDKCGVVGWVSDTIEAGAKFDYDLTEDVKTVTCYNGKDGQITISGPTGGYPWVDGYSVFIAGVVDTMTDGSEDLVIDNLPVGTHEVIISDSICSAVKLVTIKNTTPITFDLDYTDAPCTAATGTIWITLINGKGVDTINVTGWKYKVTGPGVDTTLAVGDTLEGLMANYYSAWIMSPTCDPVAYDAGDGSKNNIPILDDGSITYSTIVTNVKCFGDDNGTIRVKDVLRTCANCNVGAVYEFMVTGLHTSTATGWMAITDTADMLAADTFLVEVRDANDPDVCIVEKKVIVTGPTEMLDFDILEVTPPSCDDGNDGHVRMMVYGGTPPYQYSVDNAPNWRTYPNFGLTEGAHILQVKDAHGCIVEKDTIVPELDSITITAELQDTIICTGDKPTILVTLNTYTHYDDIAKYKLYSSKAQDPRLPGATPFYNDSTTFAAGTYYIAAKDINGCWSDLDTVVIKDVTKLEWVSLDMEPATCYETWSGRAIMTVTGGNPDPVYYFTYANNIDALNNPSIVWFPFTGKVDTTDYVELQKGTYWFKVKDACDTETEAKMIEIDGYDPIEITKVDVVNVLCYGDKNGSITVSGAKGGGPGFGVGNYLYTLVQFYGEGQDSIVGKELQASNTFSKLAAGNYMVYVYDQTDPTADPAQCEPDMEEVTVKTPDELYFEYDVKHVSCAGEENGEIYVDIFGGTGGTWGIGGQPTAAKTDKKAYEVTINQIKGDYNYSLKLADAIDTVVFQTMGGEFEIIVMDANGCSYKDTVTVFEPKPWVINAWYKDPSDCGVADGEIWAVITGGFDTLDISGAEIEVSLDGVYSRTITMGDTVMLSDTAIYDVKYTITAVNTESSLDYIVLADDQCEGKKEITLIALNPFEFEVDVECAQCYGENNGKVTISDITGGSGLYQIQLVGGENPVYDATDESLWYPMDSKGKPSYVAGPIVFDTLTAGTYWVYMRDKAGFTLAACCRPIEFKMCQPDSLELLTVTLVNDVACSGDSTGAVSVQATGGEAPYTYAVSRTFVGTDGHPYIGLPANPAWQADSIIRGLPVGTYIGWVKDANGCITGCEINSQGLPIDDHRVVVKEAGILEWESVSIVEPKCYGGLADVKLNGVTGGSGDSMTVVLEGKTYNGLDTTYMFGPVATGLGNYTLKNVYASDSSGYVVYVATDADCKAGGDTIWVTQPPVFTVDAVITSNAYCYGDNEVLVVIETKGGTAPFKYDIYKDGVKIRENSIIVNHVLAVGAKYVVVAKDALGCNVSDTLMIDTPLPVEFTIADISCYGEAKASAKITAHGTPGRSFTVKYKQIEKDNNPTNWTYYNGTFTESIEMIDTFMFDNENIDDVHYEFIVEDEYGCESELGVMTFDRVQHPVKFDAITVGEVGECATAVTVIGKGGILPYSLWVDNVMMTGLTVELEAGYHTLALTDAHLRCTDVMDSFMVEINPVVRDTMIYTFYNEEVEFTDSVAGVDSMLMEGVYTFMYVDTASTCERTLMVTVEGKAHEWVIADIASDTTLTDTSIVQIAGTVTGVYEGGFFMQDANTANSGIAVASAEAVEIGDGVVAVGTLSEMMMVTTLTATELTVGDATVVVVPMDMTAPSAIEAEMYESMLVSVNGARANAVDTAGMWTVYYEVTDMATVNDWLFAYTPVEGNYYNVTGIVNGKDDMFKLEPRMEADVVDVTVTTKVDPSQAIGFKVYPNPFNDKIYIDNNDKLVRVVISNIAGQRVIDVKYPEREIRTATLVSGVYLVNLFTEEGLAKTERIVKR